MESRNGTDYAQNYDVIVKWIAAALRGETLDVLGVRTGRIKDVFGLEPVGITIKAGRLDVMARDENDAVYHIEEQRNQKKSDMYRFAAYHFLGAKQLGGKMTDIILASGDVYAGKKEIVTESGKYKPIVIDFSRRDGPGRLREIREAVRKGEFENWLELVFLPLFGRGSGAARSEMAENVIRFETELYRAKKIPAKLLAATLIMSNKVISKERLRQMWEEIKMLDIIEIAREKGIQEGKSLGIQEGIREGKSLGMLEAIQEMIVDDLTERFAVVPVNISERIRNIRNSDALKGIRRQALKCKDIREFEAVLDRV